LGLVNESTGEFIDDATVSLTVYECDGQTAVGGVDWPVVLTSAGSGVYSGTFNAYDNIEARKKYTIRINVESGSNYSEFERSVMAERRRF
jgi:hypothetical protein